MYTQVDNLNFWCYDFWKVMNVLCKIIKEFNLHKIEQNINASVYLCIVFLLCFKYIKFVKS